MDEKAMRNLESGQRIAYATGTKHEAQGAVIAHEPFGIHVAWDAGENTYIDYRDGEHLSVG